MQASRARADCIDTNVEDRVAMWERSVRDIFAALVDDEGTTTFGFSLTASKNPQEGELPAINLPPPPSSLHTRSAMSKPKFVAAGGTKPIERARLSAVNGQQVSGCTAQEIKDMVASGRLLLCLDLVTAGRKERRVVWCRRVQTLEKVKSRLDTFLNARSAVQASSSGWNGGGGGLELLRDGLQRLLLVLNDSHSSGAANVSSEQHEHVEKRFAEAMAEFSSGPQETLEYHLFSAVARALVPHAALASHASKSNSPLGAGAPCGMGSHSGRDGGGADAGNASVGSIDGGSGGGCASAGSPLESHQPAAGGGNGEVTRLHGEVARLQELLEKARAEAAQVRVEADAAKVVKPSWVQYEERVKEHVQEAAAAAAAAAAQGAEAHAQREAELLAQHVQSRDEVARMEESARTLAHELEQERNDAAHFRDVCVQLRSTNAALDARIAEAEQARNAALEVCVRAEGGRGGAVGLVRVGLGLSVVGFFSSASLLPRRIARLPHGATLLHAASARAAWMQQCE